MSNHLSVPLPGPGHPPGPDHPPGPGHLPGPSQPPFLLRAFARPLPWIDDGVDLRPWSWLRDGEGVPKSGLRQTLRRLAKVLDDEVDELGDTMTAEEQAEALRRVAEAKEALLR